MKYTFWLLLPCIISSFAFLIPASYGQSAVSHSLSLYLDEARVIDDSVYVDNKVCINGECSISNTSSSITIKKLKAGAATDDLHQLMSGEKLTEYLCEEKELKKLLGTNAECTLFALQYNAGYEVASDAEKYIDEYRNRILADKVEYTRQIKLPAPELHPRDVHESTMIPIPTGGNGYISKRIAINIGTEKVWELDTNGNLLQYWYQKPEVITGILGILVVLGGIARFLWKRKVTRTRK